MLYPEEERQYIQMSYQMSTMSLPPHPSEIEGKQIKQSENGTFHVCYSDRLTVRAALLDHTVPCVGYVIEEEELAGKLDISVLKKRGVPPGPLYGQIKQGKPITLPSGEVICPEECIGPSRPGRKVVVLGDTRDSSQISDIGHGCDVLVHEATNENADREKAIEHGHSTSGKSFSSIRYIHIL